jgi:hypothetical protein
MNEYRQEWKKYRWLVIYWGGDIRRLYPRRYDRFSPFRETVPYRCCVSLCGRLLGISVGRILRTYFCV